MNITQIEQNIKAIITNFNPESFIYDLLLAYGLPKTTIARLKKGSSNLSKEVNEILLKKKLFFKVVSTDELYSATDTYKNQPNLIKHDPRFIIITDYQQILAIDTKTFETLDSKISELDKCFDFFLPWSGMEKATYRGENPADVKAAERMAKLFDEIRKDNPTLTSKEQLHSLNVFLSRLLFCFFAEDTGIFEHKQFTNAIKNYTQPTGEDLHEYLDKIFAVMNHNQRNDLPDYIGKFPYVNGGLFKDNHPVPQFGFKSRQLLLENGDLDWSVINPDIFGSMMQAVVDSAQRSGLGMHYTSVPNIMKVIEPLFLNELKEEFEKSRNEPAKLNKLFDRISTIKIFDPACGSGNFLIIAYNELRNLEITIIKRLYELRDAVSGFEPYQLELIPKRQQSLAATFQSSLFSRITIGQFYGIEIDDFAHEIAKLSLWLAEHQMNMKFKNEFGFCAPALPLKDSGNIVCANACRINWDEVCPKTPDDEIYVLGNPPYLGSRNQNSSHKEDMKLIFTKNYKSLDYISSWFYLASNYIRHFNIKYAFVSTNSICQGEQVGLLWSLILDEKLEIFFTHKSFKWVNNAKRNAGVTVVIIGIRKISKERKIIYDDKLNIVDNITPYLTSNSHNIYIPRTTNPISKLPQMVYGSLANDGGNLILSKAEYDEIIINYPNSIKFLHKFIGSEEYINGKVRYCLFIKDLYLKEAKQIPSINSRLNNVYNHRIKSTEKSTRLLAERPNHFYFSAYSETSSIIVPRVSSERRDYIPIGFLDENTIISDSAIAIYDPESWIFGVISSKMHMAWVRAVAGRLETRIRYSSTLCYNTFPFPNISKDQKKRIEMYVFDVLDEREKHSEKTLAELYDPDKMPDGLRQAHHNLDIAIEQCYRLKPFVSDEERLEYLFTLYEQMTSKGTNK